MAGWWLLSSAGEMVASSPSPSPGSPPPSTPPRRYTRGTIGDGLGLSYLEYILEYLLLHMIKFIKFIQGESKKSVISKNNYRELLSSNAFFWVFFWWFFDLFVPDMQHLPSIYHNNPTVRIFVAIAIFWDHTFFWLTLYLDLLLLVACYAMLQVLRKCWAGQCDAFTEIFHFNLLLLEIIRAVAGSHAVSTVTCHVSRSAQHTSPVSRGMQPSASDIRGKLIYGAVPCIRNKRYVIL